jgi:hypothetical protein
MLYHNEQQNSKQQGSVIWKKCANVCVETEDILVYFTLGIIILVLISKFEFIVILWL